ncbi:MAG: hypothetical protein ACI9M3_000757 [Bacteroidia bacterium]|jgi:hypothetical protein
MCYLAGGIISAALDGGLVVKLIIYKINRYPIDDY